MNGESFFITGTVAITVNKIHCYTYKNVIDKCGISVIGIKTAAHFFQHGGDGFCILHVAAAGGANQIFFLLNLMLFGINSGASVFLSQFWGTRDLKNVRRTMGMMYLLGAVAVTLFTLGAVLAPRFLVSFYVHEEPALTMSASYLRIVGISYPVTALSMILSMVCRCTGDVSIPTRASFLSIGFNVGGNALLIFGLCGFPALGLEGAAIATALSQAASAVWVVSFLCSKHSVLRISLPDLRPRADMIGRIAALGISPFIMQITESAISLVLNNGLQTYGGDLYVGSMTILNSVMQIAFSLNNGFAGGVQSIISYNYGASNFDRVKQTFRRMITTTFLMGAVFSLSVDLFPAAYAGLFTDNPELIALTAKVLPLFTAGMWIFGVQTGCQNTFLGLGQAKISLFFALLRKVLLLIPLALLLPRVGLGVWGVYLSEPIADVLSASCIGITFLFSYKKILSEEAVKRV